jgi:hypothetical protein
MNQHTGIILHVMLVRQEGGNREAQLFSSPARDPQVYICECVEVCMTIIADDRAVPSILKRQTNSFLSACFGTDGLLSAPPLHRSKADEIVAALRTPAGLCSQHYHQLSGGGADEATALAECQLQTIAVRASRVQAAPHPEQADSKALAAVAAAQMG